MTAVVWAITDLTNGRKLVGLEDAGEYFGYSNVYIGVLCRAGVKEICSRPVKIEKLYSADKRCQPVHDPRSGRTWPSIAAASEELGIPRSTITNSIYRNRPVSGIWFRKA